MNRKIKLYQNIDTIENPKTITDKKNKAKLELFIIEAKKLKTLNEAFTGGPKNKKEADAMQTFFDEIHFAEFSQRNTRVHITQY